MRFRRVQHTIKAAMSLTGTRPAYAAGVRASVATVLPLALGLLTGNSDAATWMSIGGFNGALADRGGSYRSRAWMMALLLPTSALAAILGTSAQRHIALVLVVTALVAFGASVLRVWGNTGISVGLASLTVYVIALAIPSDAPMLDSGLRALFVVLGGGWAMLVALMLWPLMPYRPARQAVSACYAALADYVDDTTRGARAQHTSEWPVQRAPVITNVRTALEHASEVLVQLRRGRPGTVDRGELLLVLTEQADQLFGHIVALGETLAPLRGTDRDEVLHVLAVEAMGEIARTARQISAAVLIERGPASVAIAWSAEPLQSALQSARVDSVHAQYAHAAVIIARAAQFASAAAIAAESLNGKAGANAEHDSPIFHGRAAEEGGDSPNLLDALRTVLAPGSLIVRFALRVAIVTTIAVALGDLLDIKRGYWVTITVIVILQPYTGVTLTRAVQRVLGTVLGALLAVGLGAFFHDTRAILVIATIFVACCVALLPLNYAAFSVFLTPTFVLLAEASAGDWTLAGTRVLNTLLGGALALLGARLLWPSPERARFPSYAATALRASRGYLSCVIERFDDSGHAAGEEMRAARRALGVATVNATESLQRALADVLGDERKLAPALTFMAYLRRVTASTAALAIARHAAGGTTRAALEPFRAATCTLLDELAESLDAGRVASVIGVPEVAGASPAVQARIERLSRQLATLEDAVRRVAANVPATADE